MSEIEETTCSRSRSRSPISREQQETCTEDNAESTNENTPFNQRKTRYQSHVLISNIPEKWHVLDLRKFLINLMNYKNMAQNNFYCVVTNCSPKKGVVKFPLTETAREMHEKLQNVVVEGRMLYSTIVSFAGSPPPEEVRKMPALNSLNESFHDRNIVKSFHGLSSHFLQQLGIKPPLCSKLLVTNLAPEVDEEKLKEVFSLAGSVVDLHLTRQDTGGFNNALINYDHPVEAVQAVSMFNNQSLCGSIINVCLHPKKISTTALPPGLKGIGPGLGINGKPLQCVRAFVEIESLKYDIRHCLENIGNTNQTSTNTNLGNTNMQPNVQSDLLKMFPAMVNPNNMANVNPNPVANQNVQSVLQGLMQQRNLINTLNVQNTLQNVLGLMSKVGNEQTNQYLPPISSNMGNQQNRLPMHNQHMPPNMFNHRSSHNMPNRMAPPYIFNQQTPPRMFNRHKRQNFFKQRNPPNMFNHQNPPNMCNKQNPPNISDEQIPSAPKYQSECSSRFGKEDSEEAGSSKGSDKEYSHTTMGDIVVLKNLPPTLCIETLKSKMEEIGDIQFAEMTGEGKAVIRFATESQAEKCINIFDKCKVDEQIIEVRYV